MFGIKMLCYDFSKPTPYEDQMEAKFQTRAHAERAMYHAILEELNDLNGISEDGTFPERRFTVQLDNNEHDAVIICWDGEDYTPVTCYDITNESGSEMTYERAMELLNNIIDHIAVAENTSTQIQELVKMGFQPDELVDHFNYSRRDVDDVAEENECGDEEEELPDTPDEAPRRAECYNSVLRDMFGKDIQVSIGFKVDEKKLAVTYFARNTQGTFETGPCETVEQAYKKANAYLRSLKNEQK